MNETKELKKRMDKIIIEYNNFIEAHIDVDVEYDECNIPFYNMYENGYMKVDNIVLVTYEEHHEYERLSNERRTFTNDYKKSIGIL